MDNLPPDVTLPVVVWRNVAEDLRAIGAGEKLGQIEHSDTSQG